MPNHVTTICTVSGSKADRERFAATHIVKGKEDHLGFDFSTIIPMPKSVRDTHSSTDAELGVFALVGFIKPAKYRFDPRTEADFLAGYGILPADVKAGGREALKVWLAEHRPQALVEGRASMMAVAETGFADWYEWSCEHWGTKWGAYDYEPRNDGDPLVFKFETAWSFPEPIFRRLATMYPSLVFAITSYDEGSNFACVGEFNGKNDYRTVDATDELYAVVYGHPPENDDEDDSVEGFA